MLLCETKVVWTSPEAFKHLGNHLSLLNTNVLHRICFNNSRERFTKGLGLLSEYFCCEAERVSVYGKWWLRIKTREKHMPLFFRCIHGIWVHTLLS